MQLSRYSKGIIIGVLLAIFPCALASDNKPSANGATSEKSSDAKKEATGNKWILRIPEQGKNKNQWKALINYLIQEGLDFGAMAAAHRMLVYFEDLDSREFAYKQIIEIGDRAWPFSTRSLFIPGDIEPRTILNFAQSYNIYKALLNEEAGMHQWAKFYYSRVDKEKSKKYLFHEAIRLYENQEVEKAIEALRNILSSKVENNDIFLTIKTARTLARIYYEKERYEESLDIYQKFLLKLNPTTPEDFLEASWNLFRLKRYDRALGYLYNLESMASGRKTNLERYILRVAIYRDNCDSERISALSTSFHRDYKSAIDGIKTGARLELQNALHELPLATNINYNEAYNKLKHLQQEEEKNSTIPNNLKIIYNFLYDSEIESQKIFLKLHVEEAMERAAKQLITVSEMLKFMAYDVVREKFNPNVVFDSNKNEKTKISELALLPNGKKVFWNQFNDYWRDERQLYLVGIKNRCAE